MKDIDDNLLESMLSMLYYAEMQYGQACIAGSAALYLYAVHNENDIPDAILSSLDFQDIDIFVPCPQSLLHRCRETITGRRMLVAKRGNTPRNTAQTLKYKLLCEWQQNGLHITPTTAANPNEDGYPLIFEGIDEITRIVWNFKLQVRNGVSIPVQVILVNINVHNRLAMQGFSWEEIITMCFDLTACQFWIKREASPRGYVVEGTQQATASIRQGNMTYNSMFVVPFCVAVYRIRKYIQRGFSLSSLVIDRDILGSWYQVYFLDRLTQFLKFKTEITYQDVGVHRPMNRRSVSIIATSLSLVLTQQECIDEYVASNQFYDYEVFENRIIYVGGRLYHHLKPWYDRTAKGLRSNS